MKKQFVTYEIALGLKELGFDEEVLAYFTSEKKLEFTDTDLSISGGQWLLPAPLWHQAFDWLRKKYGIMVQVEYTFKRNVNWKYRIGFSETSKPYTTPEKAREKGVLRAIEIVKNEINE